MYDAETLRHGDGEKIAVSSRRINTASPYHRVSVSVPEEL
jgi:hypothetical protein